MHPIRRCEGATNEADSGAGEATPKTWCILEKLMHVEESVRKSSAKAWNAQVDQILVLDVV